MNSRPPLSLLFQQLRQTRRTTTDDSGDGSDSDVQVVSDNEDGGGDDTRAQRAALANYMEYMDARAAGTVRVSALAVQHMLSDADSE